MPEQTRYIKLIPHVSGTLRIWEFEVYGKEDNNLSVSLDANSLSLNAGETKNITVSYNLNGDERSDDFRCEAVPSTGVVTIGEIEENKSKGQFTIPVIAGDAIGSCDIEVKVCNGAAYKMQHVVATVDNGNLPNILSGLKATIRQYSTDSDGDRPQYTESVVSTLTDGDTTGEGLSSIETPSTHSYDIWAIFESPKPDGWDLAKVSIFIPSNNKGVNDNDKEGIVNKDIRIAYGNSLTNLKEATTFENLGETSRLDYILPSDKECKYIVVQCNLNAYFYASLAEIEAFEQAELPDGPLAISDYAGDEFTLDSGELVSIAGVEYPVGSYVDYIFGNKSLAWGCVTSGTLTVSGEGDNKTISADFLTDYGFSVKFSYSGVLAIKGIPQTGLTENMVLDLTGASAQFECVGDVDRLNNCRNWYITILPADGYDHGFISYICSRGKTFFDGIVTETYTASPSRTPWKGEYSKGKKNDAGQLSGTWALTGFDENGQPQVNAPAVDGDLNITRHDDGKTYTIQFDLNDGIGHNFKGEWTGEPELINSCGDVDEAGIDGVLQDSNVTVTGIYDLNGVMVSEPTQGVYIIRYSDGSVSKKIIK